MGEKILVDRDAFVQVMNAVDRPLEHGHLIRELQATRNLPGETNPINTLVQDLEADNTVRVEAVAVAPVASKTVIYTSAEMEMMSLYQRLKGSMSTTDDPEEGIRFFTSLVDRAREERSVIAIRNR